MAEMAEMVHKERKENVEKQVSKDLKETLPIVARPMSGGEEEPALPINLLSWCTLGELEGVRGVALVEQLTIFACLTTLTIRSMTPMFRERAMCMELNTTRNLGNLCIMFKITMYHVQCVWQCLAVLCS